MRFLPRAAMWAMLVLGMFVGASCTETAKEKPTVPTTAPAAAPARASVEIIVTDMNDKPLSGADVTLDGCYMKPSKGKTDAAGRVSLLVPEKGETGFSISAEAQGYASVSKYWNQDEDGALPKAFVLKTEPGITVGGRVVDQDQKPIEGATVKVWARKKNEKLKQSLSISETTKTNADGRWELGGVAKDSDKFEVGYFHHHYLADTYYPMSEIKMSPTFTDKSAVYQLKRGVPVTAIVLDSEGKPAAGASVTYGTERGVSNAIPAVKTDASGRFEMGILAGTQNILMVQYKDHAPRIVSFKAGAKIDDIKLSKGRAIAGDVVDKEGRPIAGVSVSFGRWDDHSIDGPRLTTDKNGKFVWAHSGEGAYTVGVYKEDYLSLDDQAVSAERENHFVLLPRPVFRGKVIDAETRAPIKNFKIAEGMQWRNSDRTSWQIGNEESLNKRAKRPAEGVFEISPYTAYKGIAYRVSAEGYAPADSALLDPLKGDQEFTVEMKKAAKLSGILRDAGGKPVAGVEVLAMPDGYGYLRNGKADMWGRDRFARSVTDGEGRFALPPQAEKFTLCALRDDGYVYEPSEKLKFPVELTFKKWATVKGSVRDGTKLAPAGTKISMTLVSDDRESRMRAHYDTTTDAQGRFEITRVIESRFYVARQEQTSANRWTNISYERGATKAGETVEVNLGGKGRPVTGRLLIPDSLPAGKWEVIYVSIEEDKKVERPKLPIDLDNVALKDRAEAMKKWRESDEGKKWIQEMSRTRQAQSRSYFAHASADNSFTARDVQAGKYRLMAYINTKRDPASGRSEPIAMAEKSFVVPEIPGGVSDEVLDIGGVPVTLINPESAADSAPTYSFKTLDGREIKSEDLRGKYVVLDLWSTHQTTFDPNAAVLQGISDAYGKRDDFAIYSVNLENDTKVVEQFIREYKASWPQGIVDGWNEVGKIARQFAARNAGNTGGIAVWLLGKDGKVMARDTDANKIRAVLDEKLK